MQTRVISITRPRICGWYLNAFYFLQVTVHCALIQMDSKLEIGMLYFRDDLLLARNKEKLFLDCNFIYFDYAIKRIF